MVSIAGSTEAQAPAAAELGRSSSKDKKNSSKFGSSSMLKKLHGLNKGSGVPKGHVCVYVGPRRERFVIPISYLSHSFFQIMLLQSQETFEFCHEGGLIIPCRVPLFESVLEFMKSNSDEDLKKPVESYTLLKCVTDMNLYK